jgi:hypothetical protein
MIADQPDRTALRALLMRYVRDATAGWSCGSFGAIAEFARMSDEAAEIDTGWKIGACTDRGGIRVHPVEPVRAIAYEMLSRDATAWQQGVALCLPEGEAAMSGRTVLTELGPDKDALRPEDRSAILFDLGLGQLQLDACVRTSDPSVIAKLRAGLGRPVFEHGNPLAAEMPALSPHRVFVCRFGRIEVYQPIPTPGGTSPDGPHTHVLTKLLRHKRTHAANIPLPSGWIPCMTLFPANPVRDEFGSLKPFDRSVHDAFQSVWEQFADAGLIELKRAVQASVIAGRPTLPDVALADTREGRTAIRVTLRQLHYLHRASPVVAALRAQVDREAEHDLDHDG